MGGNGVDSMSVIVLICLCPDGCLNDADLLSAGWVFGVIPKVRILALSAGGTKTCVVNPVVAVSGDVFAND